MNLKTMLIEIISSDQRIRDYEKDPNQKNAERCIKAYKEAVIEFCKKCEEQEQDYSIVQDDDSHWYWIPKNLMDKFDLYIEDRENDSGIDREVYRTGGGPNMVPEYYTKEEY